MFPELWHTRVMSPRNVSPELSDFADDTDSLPFGDVLVGIELLVVITDSLPLMSVSDPCKACDQKEVC